MLSPERKNYLTASVCGSVLGHGRFKTRTDVLRDKVKALLGKEEQADYNPALAHGNANEHVGVEYAMKMHAFEHTGNNQKFFTHDIFGVTPDGVYTFPDGRIRLLEVKAPYKQTYTANEVPLLMPEYYDNMQLAMHVTGAMDTLFVVVSPDGTITHHIYERSEMWFRQNEKALRAFWQSVLDSVAYSTSEAEGIDVKMVELARQIKALEDELDAHKNALKKKYKSGILLGKVLVTSETRAGAVDWETAFAKHGINADEYRKSPTTVTKVLIDTKPDAEAA